MSRDYQKYIAVGRLVADPKIYPVKEGDEGDIVASCHIAVGREWKDKDDKKHEEVEYIPLRFFGGLAKIVDKHVKKGKEITIDGEVRNSKYTDREGIERFSYEIHVSELRLGPDAKSSAAA